MGLRINKITMPIHTYSLTDTRTATPVVLAQFSYDDATKELTIDCSNSANIPSSPTNGEQVFLGLLQDIEIAAQNKLYNPDSPISEPLAFNNPDITGTNYQYQSRSDNEDLTLATRIETQTAYAFKFLAWFKSTAPSAANAINDND
jgi:hypothetical protein